MFCIHFACLLIANPFQIQKIDISQISQLQHCCDCAYYTVTTGYHDPQWDAIRKISTSKSHTLLERPYKRHALQKNHLVNAACVKQKTIHSDKKIPRLIISMSLLRKIARHGNHSISEKHLNRGLVPTIFVQVATCVLNCQSLNSTNLTFCVLFVQQH